MQGAVKKEAAAAAPNAASALEVKHLRHLLSWLTAPRDVGVAAQVCRTWYKASTDAAMWKMRCARVVTPAEMASLPSIAGAAPNFKALYIARTRGLVGKGTPPAAAKGGAKGGAPPGGAGDSNPHSNADMEAAAVLGGILSWLPEDEAGKAAGSKDKKGGKKPAAAAGRAAAAATAPGGAVKAEGAAAALQPEFVAPPPQQVYPSHQYPQQAAAVPAVPAVPAAPGGPAPSAPAGAGQPPVAMAFVPPASGMQPTGTPQPAVPIEAAGLTPPIASQAVPIDAGAAPPNAPASLAEPAYPQHSAALVSAPASVAQAAPPVTDGRPPVMAVPAPPFNEQGIGLVPAVESRAAADPQQPVQVLPSQAQASQFQAALEQQQQAQAAAGQLPPPTSGAGAEPAAGGQVPYLNGEPIRGTWYIAPNGLPHTDVPGVTWHKQRQKWHVHRTVGAKMQSGGLYALNDLNSAIAASMRLRQEHMQIM